jgi:glycosyltransferase involved in cell wall biosynthesis
VKDYAARSSVAKDVIFTGFTPLADIPHFYSACEVMVYPSLFEGFGFPIIEAMSCGASVTCSNTSSMEEIAGDWMPTFNPLDVDAIEGAMEEALRIGKTADLSERGITYGASFKWEETAKQVMSVYQAVKERG